MTRATVADRHENDKVSIETAPLDNVFGACVIYTIQDTVIKKPQLFRVCECLHTTLFQRHS